MIFLKTLLISISLFNFQPKHDFHNSITEISFNNKSKSLEVVMRVFMDDLEKAIARDNKKGNFELSNDSKDDILIRKYIFKKFYLKNKKNQRLKQSYVGKKRIGDRIVIYIEIPYRKSPHGLKVRNATLTDIFFDQQNIVNIFYKTKTKTLLCLRGSETKTINLGD